MKLFNTVNRLALYAFWVMFVINFVMPILATEINYIFYVGLGLLVIHALEFALVFNRLKQRGRAGFSDFAAVLLVGLFHWMPILRKPVA